MSNVSDFFKTFATKYPNARCVTDPEAMFPTNEDDESGKKYCRTCPHQFACLKEAIANDEQGIWGNTTRNERKELFKTVEQKLREGEK